MKRFFGLALLSAFSFCILNAQDVDSLRHPKDSALPMPLWNFFTHAGKLKDPAKTTLVTSAGKRISFDRFIATLSPDIDSKRNVAEHALGDLDNDGRQELVISNFTGEAHCCDEIYIFKENAGRYQQTAKLFAGNVIITDSNTLIYDFHEQFGYFFTCFACGYSDTTDAAAVPMHHIELKYKNGKLVPVAGDKELNSLINDNLAKLTELPYEKPDDELFQDSGIRKEIAMNLAVYYYRFGKNLTATKALFNKYYKHPDSRAVWNEFNKQIQAIRSGNNF